MELPVRPKLARRARLQWDERDQKYFILYPERGLALNPSAAEVLKLCDGSRSVDDIVATLASTMTTPLEIVAQDVRAFLERLVEKKLIE
jgi:coenzyme PQQ biosynthesis protein PqqD